MHLPLQSYELAILAFMLALLVKQLLDSMILGQKSPFLVFFAAAVMVSAWYGGMKAGLFATVLAAFARNCFLASENYSLLCTNVRENLQPSQFLSAQMLMSWWARLLPGSQSAMQLDTLKSQPHQENINPDRQCNQQLCKHVGDIVLIVRPDGQIIAANQAAVQIYGYQQEELLALKIQDLRSLPSDDLLPEKMAIAGKQGILFETIHRGKDGRTFPVEVSSQGAVIGNEKVILNIIREISERKQPEAKLQNPLQKLTFHVENSPLAVVGWDSEFRVSRWSPQAEALFGWTGAEVLGLHPSDWQFVLPEDVAAVSGVIQRLLDGSEQRNISRNRNYTKDGRVVHCEWYNSALLDESGNLVSVLSLVLDVSDRHRANVETLHATSLLRQSEQRYRDLADAMPLLVLTAQPDGGLDGYNQRWFDYTGMTQEQTKGWGWQQVLHPDDLQPCLERWNEAIRTGEPYEMEHRLRRKDGTYRWHLTRAVPRRDQEGRVVSWVGTCTDIDERKRTEETQRFLASASQELASSLDYQTTLTGVARLCVPRIADWCAVDMVEDDTIRRLAVVHADPSKVEWAQELQKRYPPHPDDAYGVPNVLRTGKSELYPEVADDILVATARDTEHLAMLRQVGFTSAMVVPLMARGRILGAITLVWAESGRRYDASDLAFAEELARRASLAVDNASLYKAVQQELTHRTQTEVALRESEERFRTMADSAPVLLWVAGTDGRCTFFNQGWLTFRGSPLEEELGNGWTEGVHPEDLPACLDTRRLAFHARENFEIEYRLLRADGEYRWVVDRGTPRFMPDGSFAGYIGSCTDITERKSTEQALRDRAGELAQLSAVLAQTNAVLEGRNKELDQFAYIVSHDLKAPLRAIAHLSTWIEEDIQDQLTEETRHQMDLLRGRVYRMEALIDGLLQYSRVGRVKTPAALVNVPQLLFEVIDSLAPPPEFTIEVVEPMPTLETEKTPLEQVFTHLIDNAIKHHNRPDGHVKVSVQDKADFWEFAVADDGPGIEERYHEKAFVMFQTLEARDKVENAGVGLAIVKKIIEHKGGTIRLESQPDRGATFYFTWPKLNTIK